jgi:hypothetical protein
VVQYWRCQHEVFAQFGECARWDGLSEKLTRYEDDGCTLVAEVVESFQRRHDKLRERRSAPQVRGWPRRCSDGIDMSLTGLTVHLVQHLRV